eukprot:m.155354 g.155354  ORF g.155354 m.155354 type:complete len:502 (-) comp16276_c2_seq1:955-2460(-)
MESVKLSKAEVDACAFTSWFPKFKHLSMASRILPMSEEFIAYLLDDGPLFLPSREPPKASRQQEETQQNEAESTTSIETPAKASKIPHFPGLLEEIDKAINSLGGAVLPKLNWSSPKDAAWIVPNQTMRVTTAEDVVLLLKSSECIQFDIQTPYRGCEGFDENAQEKADQYHLVLRHWMDMHPSYEFRCFVDNHKLFAVTQRHTDVHEKSIERRKDDILKDIYYFFIDHVREEFELPSYIFDIYYDQGRIWLVDLNPMSTVSDAGLFTWEEIQELAKQRHGPFVDKEVYATDEEIERLLAAHEQKTVDPTANDGSKEDGDVEEVPTFERTAVDDVNSYLLHAFQTNLSCNPQAFPLMQQAEEDEEGNDFDNFEEGQDTVIPEHESQSETQQAASQHDTVVAASEPESDVVAMRRIEFRVVREAARLTSGKFAAQAFPRDVVEIASTGDVSLMVKAMQQASLDQLQEDDDDDDEEENEPLTESDDNEADMDSDEYWGSSDDE